MKKIIIFITIILIVFLIFIYAKPNKINYMSIGDNIMIGVSSYNRIGYSFNKYIENYLIENNYLKNYNDLYYNNSIKGLINDIKINKLINKDNKEYYLKKELRESDYLVISIGMNELYYRVSNYNKEILKREFNIMYNSYIELFKLIKKYAKNEIIFLGLYNPYNEYNNDIDNDFNNINIKLNNLCNKYNIKYLELYQKIKNGNYLNNNYYLNNKGNILLANLIIDNIE